MSPTIEWPEVIPCWNPACDRRKIRKMGDDDVLIALLFIIALLVVLATLFRSI